MKASNPTLSATPKDEMHPQSPPFTAALRGFGLLLLLGLLHMGCANSQTGPAGAAVPPNGLQIKPGQAAAVGKKIWENECGGTVSGLTSWNRGEDFASLGIGHFIWYTPSRRGPFEESFPALLDYIRARGTAAPAWLSSARGCPWNSYDEFHAARNGAQMSELRNFLARTVPLQTEFLIRRLESALPKMRAALSSESDRTRITNRFYAVAESPQGIYALIDYVNFKGEGVAKSERYKGQGWGLLQVLEGMKGNVRGPAAAREFSASSKRVLQRRVANSPPSRNESRWLPGWTKRCDSYARPL